MRIYKKQESNLILPEHDHDDDIVNRIKGQRISWLGHLERMEEDRMPKKMLTQELEGRRRRQRPRKGWRKEVERDLQVLGVRRRKELVIDRENWRNIFRQAKAHSGLKRQWKKNIIHNIYIYIYIYFQYDIVFH